MTDSRRALWIPLLQRLTEVSPNWVIYKNAGSALHGFGDIDSTAPHGDWGTLIDEFRRWAVANGLGPVFVCQHAPTFGVVAALHGDEPFFELDLTFRKVFLGSTMFTPPTLVPLSRIGDDGFRHLRPGAEGLIKLICNGSNRDGTCDAEGLRAKDVPRLLAEDPAGVEQMAALWGPAESAALRLVQAVTNGSWDRRAVLTLEGWFMLRAFREPQSVVNRVRFHRELRDCPVLRAITSGRRVVGDTDAWLDSVRANHAVY